MNTLENAQAITIDGKEKTVTSMATLYELYQENGSKEWIQNGRLSKAIFLGETILFNLPLEEGGSRGWFKVLPKVRASNLQNFYKGTDENWGPAQKFAKSNQTANVEYSLFDKTWKVVDIGAFKAIVTGKNDFIKDGDRLHFVTSRQGPDILIYLDSRHGEAKGTGGAFIGTEFNPETEIESIL